MPYHTQDGQQVQPGPRLGEGAEGIVYLLQNDAGTAVKVWKEAGNGRNLAAKITAMLQQPPAQTPAAPSHPDEESHPIVAWPTGMLLDEQNHPAGFTMPALDPSQYRSIFNYFNPQARSRLPRTPDDQTLNRIAANLAAAMAALHHAGHVIGDVNELNTMVGPQHQVTLVDADSMQVRDPETGRLWRCTKGRDDYTPPRLQGTTLRDHDRTPDDDRFGLAVLIFKLLMNGQHPFASTSPLEAVANITLAQKIRQEYYPYNESGHTPQEHRPSVPYQHAWQDLDFNLRHLFRRAFDPDARVLGARPTPEEWQEELLRTSRNPAPRRRRPTPTTPRPQNQSSTGAKAQTATRPARNPQGTPTPTPAPSNTQGQPILSNTQVLTNVAVFMASAMLVPLAFRFIAKVYPGAESSLPLLMSMAPIIESIGTLMLFTNTGIAVIGLLYAGMLFMTAGNTVKTAQALNLLRFNLILLTIIAAVSGFRVILPEASYQQVGQNPAAAAYPEPENASSTQGSCDEVLQTQLIPQSRADTARKINTIVQMIQSQIEECSPNHWSPVAVNARDQQQQNNTAEDPRCFGQQQQHDTGRTRNPGASVGTTTVPPGLRTNGVPGGDVRPDSSRDTDNNILVFWSPSPEERPEDNATCWMYHASTGAWTQNH